jgi:hypothetical protein
VVTHNFNRNMINWIAKLYKNPNEVEVFYLSCHPHLPFKSFKKLRKNIIFSWMQYVDEGLDDNQEWILFYWMKKDTNKKKSS